MRAKQRISILLAGAMMAGSIGMLSPIQANAEGSSMTVYLGVPTNNDYTMVIPSNTEMNSDGSAKALTNGLTIKGTAMTKDVVVTLTAANDWKLKADGVTTEIKYAVYSDESCSETDKVESIEFTKTEIEKYNADLTLIGTTKDLYVKPDATDLANAEGGNYSGTITFTAELKAAATLTAEQVTALVDAVGTNKFYTSTHYSLRNALPYGYDVDVDEFAYNMNLWCDNFSIGDNGNYVFEKTGDNYKYEVVISEGKATSVIVINSYDGDVEIETYTVQN